MEPHTSFRAARHKIVWAQQNILNLQSVIDAFVQEKPYSVRLNPDTERGGYNIEVGLTRGLPIEVSLMLGDICGNLRASMDYMWMGLVRAHQGEGASKQTMPIGSNRKSLEAQIEKAPIGAALEKAQFVLVDRIQSHRDFENRGNIDIAALNDLSNWNKHNLIIATAGVTALRHVNYGGLTVDLLKVQGGIARVVGIGPDVKGEFRYEGDPVIDVVFGPHKLVHRSSVIPKLVTFQKTVVDALKAFCEAFPSDLNPIFCDNEAPRQ